MRVQSKRWQTIRAWLRRISMRGANLGDTLLGIVLFFGTIRVSAVSEVSHSLLAFVVPEGYGEAVQIMLTVGGQQAIVPVDGLTLFSYDPPQVVAITLFDDGTPSMLIWPEVSVAGTAISVSGSSFGPAPAAGWTAGIASSGNLEAGRTTVTLGSTSCLIVRMSQTGIVCLARVHHDFLVVTVDGRASKPQLFDYASALNIPVIVSARVDGYPPFSGPTAGGVILHVVGSNFKDRGWLRFGSGECMNASIVVTDSTLTCVLPEGHGAEIGITFVYGAIDSNTIFWKYGNPRISGVEPGILPSGRCIVSLVGKDFGKQAYASSFVSVTDSSNSGMESNCSVLEWTHFRIVCEKSATDGMAVLFTVTSFGLKGNTFSVPLEQPIIESVTPLLLPTAGGAVVHISGRNFGTRATVTIGSSQCIINFATDGDILCASPVGQGLNVQLVVWSIGLNSNSTVVHYIAPQIQHIVPDHGGTAGSWKMHIIGKCCFVSASTLLRFDTGICRHQLWSRTRRRCSWEHAVHHFEHIAFQYHMCRAPRCWGQCRC